MIQNIRADLARRIGAIEWRGGPGRVAGEVDLVRRVALAHGLHPAATVAQAIEAALVRGERGPLVHAWLALLRQALASERQDRPAGQAYAAACAVRQAR